MRHYEIVFLVHPDQSDQTQSVLNKFSSLVEESGGKIHRSEDIGRRKLAYPIQDQFKASYALLNIECNKEVLEQIESSFKFNDSIIRNLIIVKDKAETELSALSSQTEEEDLDYFKDSETKRDNKGEGKKEAKDKESKEEDKESKEEAKEEDKESKEEAKEEDKESKEEAKEEEGN